MRYYSSGHSHRQYKPRKNWRSLGKKKKKVIQYDEASALRYSNPFAKRRKGSGIKILYLFLPALFFGWLGLMFYLPYFQVTNIKTTGQKIINKDELEVIITDRFFSKNPFWPKNNYFFLNENGIKAHIQNIYSLNQINVTKKFPNTLVIDLVESASSAVFDNGRAYYLLSEEGVILKYLKGVEYEISSNPTSTDFISNSTTPAFATSTTSTTHILQEHTPDHQMIAKEYGPYPIIYDLNEPIVSEKDLALNSLTLKAFVSFYNALERGRVVKAYYGTIKEPGAGIIIHTNKPWKIFFNPATDIGEQISNLQVVIKNSQPIEYIDLRYGEKVYWK